MIVETGKFNVQNPIFEFLFKIFLILIICMIEHILRQKYFKKKYFFKIKNNILSGEFI